MAPIAPPTVAVNHPAKVPPMMSPNKSMMGTKRRRVFSFSTMGTFSPPPGGMASLCITPMIRTVAHSARAVASPGMMPPIRAVPTFMVMGDIRQYMMMAMDGGINVDNAPDAAIQPNEYFLL